ncbi:putative transposase [Anopheles sinensis]|uniref:Putative transposase n=1 Tax=Anopheles sinensis TaxID=74873 RepID=A0A084VFQ6_ANOSI|nr:putative transposase [Anopheles sinensis]
MNTSVNRADAQLERRKIILAGHLENPTMSNGELAIKLNLPYQLVYEVLKRYKKRNTIERKPRQRGPHNQAWGHITQRERRLLIVSAHNTYPWMGVTKLAKWLCMNRNTVADVLRRFAERQTVDRKRVQRSNRAPLPQVCKAHGTG